MQLQQIHSIATFINKVTNYTYTISLSLSSQKFSYITYLDST